MAEGKIKNQAFYMMFSREDAGFGAGKEPSGYIKIEVREGKGKLTGLVQNLKDDRGKTIYKLYLIRCDDKHFNHICIGKADAAKHKVEMRWEFDPEDVGATGVSIEKFNVAAILAEYPDMACDSVVCPLAAYKGEKVEWRDRLKKLCRPAVVQQIAEEETFVRESEEVAVRDEEEVISGQDIFERYKDKIEEQLQESLVTTIGCEDSLNRDAETDSEAAPVNSAILSDNAPQLTFEYGEAGNETMVDGNYFENGHDASPGLNLNVPTEYNGDNTDTDNAAEKCMEEAENRNSCVETDGWIDNRKNNADKPVESLDSNEQNCVYRQSDTCGFESVVKDFTPCLNCIVKDYDRQSEDRTAGTGSIEMLQNNLDKYFERFDPFKSRRRDYKWWKISSPVHLNNILYQCNIKTPILFNPRVMMAHFKYRHMIVGIYSDRARRREYIVCGIPGTYNIDDRPFGEMCKWVQVEGNRPSYGSFGYWLVYMDYKTGKLLSLR